MRAEVVHESSTCSQDKCKAWESFSWNFDLLIKNENADAITVWECHNLIQDTRFFSDFDYVLATPVVVCTILTPLICSLCHEEM